MRPAWSAGSWPSTRKPVCPSSHDVAQTADGRGHDGRTARLGLEGDQPEGLRSGGHEHHVGGGVEVGQPRLRLAAGRA